MRVIAGTARSIPLIAPKGEKTRPTIDKHKETLFNCLSDRLYDSVFVDLYSGSGAIGIEALSRGARRCYFVENDKDALHCIRENLSKTKLTDGAVLIPADVRTALCTKLPEQADIIFLDPPFALHAESEIIPLIMKENRLSEGGRIVVECDFSADFTFLGGLGLEIFKEKSYSSCKHVFIKRK